ncbi:MAG: DUF427 domain-containing protein [Flavobacteriales bacterium]
MAQVIVNGTVIAESDKVINDKGVIYFPHTALKNAFFEESDTHKLDPQKGVSNYYHINCNGKLIKDAAYYFPNPNPKSRPLQNFVAFTQGVKII